MLKSPEKPSMSSSASSSANNKSSRKYVSEIELSEVPLSSFALRQYLDAANSRINSSPSSKLN